MNTYKLFWSPESRQIAEVEAKTARAAIRKAPQPYRRYLGETYAEKVLSPKDLIRLIAEGHNTGR